MNDTLKTINDQIFILKSVIAKLDSISIAMYTLGMNSGKIDKMIIKLDDVAEKLNQALGEIASKIVKTAEQNSANVVNAAVMGTKLDTDAKKALRNIQKYATSACMGGWRQTVYDIAKKGLNE